MSHLTCGNSETGSEVFGYQFGYHFGYQFGYGLAISLAIRTGSYRLWCNHLGTGPAASYRGAVNEAVLKRKTR